MRQLILATALLAAQALGPVHAQDAEDVASAGGGVLRVLDKISGDTVDLEIATGAASSLGNLQIAMIDCRYPKGDPAANAYAALEITETGKPGAIFSGWMIASAPALNALEHFRYDVWVIRCTTS